MGLLLIGCHALSGQRLEGWRNCRRKFLQQKHCLLMTWPAGRTVQSVMAHFGKAFGQDVLEIAGQELSCGQAESLDLLGAVVTVTKGYLAVFESLQAGVADGNAKHIASQIFEHFFSMTSRFGVNDPFFGSPE